MHDLTGSLYRRRLRQERLPCSVCHEEIDYDERPGMPTSFYAKSTPDLRLVQMHYACAGLGVGARV